MISSIRDWCCAESLPISSSPESTTDSCFFFFFFFFSFSSLIIINSLSPCPAPCCGPVAAGIRIQFLHLP
uniref:Uncharacterized protein n=1 Tax=Triticum urartu TaxID=4572 RepID=A0A8R7TPL5_TRIUA